MRSRLTRSLFVAVVLTPAFPLAFAWAQERPPSLEADPATVAGEIIRQGTEYPVAGAELFVDGTLMASTDDEGKFRMYLGPGNRILEIRRIGYTPAVVRLLLEPGSNVDVVIELPERSVQLDTLVIEGKRLPFGGKLAGFYKRQETLGFGQFFGPDDLERLTLSRLSDLFHRAKSVKVQCLDLSCQTKGLEVASGRSTTFGQRCFMDYYVDGISWNPGPMGVDVLNPEAVAAVEVYISPHTVPAQFGGKRARCGVVAFWTKTGQR